MGRMPHDALACFGWRAPYLFPTYEAVEAAAAVFPRISSSFWMQLIRLRSVAAKIMASVLIKVTETYKRSVSTR